MSKPTGYMATIIGANDVEQKLCSTPPCGYQFMMATNHLYSPVVFYAGDVVPGPLLEALNTARAGRKITWKRIENLRQW